MVLCSANFYHPFLVLIELAELAVSALAFANWQGLHPAKRTVCVAFSPFLSILRRTIGADRHSPPPLTP